MKAFILKYGAHLLAGLVSVLTTLSDLPAPIVKLLGPEAGVIVGLAGIVATAIHGIATATTTPTTPVPATKAAAVAPTATPPK